VKNRNNYREKRENKGRFISKFIIGKEYSTFYLFTFALVLILFYLFLFHPIYAQTSGSIAGRVVDKETQTPLIGVNVLIKKTILGASTDRLGNFFIERIPPGTYSLMVSEMGYKTKTIENVIVEPGKISHLELLLEETVIAMDPVVVTAGKHPQSMSTSHQAVDVIHLSKMVHRQNRRLEEALLPVSGIHFNEENISIRGSSGYSLFNVGSRILFMIDGVPFMTSDMGAITWDMLSLLDIDHIEIIKGAGSALYGSSAMGGVINFITRQPSSNGCLRIRMLAGIYNRPHYKEWYWTDEILHYERADLAYSRKIGPVSFRMNLSRNLSTGYMENNHVDQWNVSSRFVCRLPYHSRLDLYAAWMQSRKGGFIQWINQNSPFEVPPFHKKDELHFKTTSIYALYHLSLSSNFGLKFRVSNLISEMGTQLTVYDPGAFKPGQGLGCEVQGDWLPSPLHHITFGNEFRWDFCGSKYFGNHKGYTVSPYLQDEWTLLSNLRTTFGMRMDHHVLIDEKTNTRLSPKLGLNYRPFPQTTVRATLGSGFRAATVFEKYTRVDYSALNIIPNPDLKPEHSWFWDIGFRQIFSENAHIAFSVFQTDYWNMIEPVMNFLGTIQFQNYIRARIIGLELSTESWWWRQRIGLEASFTGIDPRDILHGEMLPYRPVITAVIRGTLRFGSASFHAGYRYASRIQKVEINPLDPRVSLKLLHLRAQIKWQNFTFQLAVNNALNYHYAQVERRMGEIRSFSVGLLTDFGE